MKKAVLGLFSFCALCGLAYYSSYLYSERYQQEHEFGTGLEAEQQPRADQAGTGDGAGNGDTTGNGESKKLPGEASGNVSGARGTSSGQGGLPGTRAPGDFQGNDREETGAGERAGIEEAAETENPLLETALPADAVQTENEYTYYLIEEFGYVNIYNSDQETIYEYTEISIGDLPEELQQEICTGKGVVNEQELYDFLENYSS